ncbi:MAG TPA: hypothetical protein VFQ90_15310 [Stellaceae bacterium]|jgi:hypothetical protein|nr:hypothetical protein [Stellaceae bacterium]
MSEPNFYLLYLDRDPGVSLDDIKGTIDRALHWYRVNPRLWVLYTTSDAEKWYGRLKNFVKTEGNVFVCKLDISDRQGMMSREFWRWIHEMEDKYNEARN